MKDKEWNAAKEPVAKLFRKWIKILGLGWYQIDIEYKAGDAEERGDGYIRAMEVASRWMYRTATVKVWLECLPTDQWKLENMIVHELCHILVAPMRTPEINYDLEEYTVETLARAFVWTEELTKKKK